MKIRMAFDFSDAVLLAIGRQTGNKKATREEAMAWIEKTITSTLQWVEADEPPPEEA